MSASAPGTIEAERLRAQAVETSARGLLLAVDVAHAIPEATAASLILAARSALELALSVPKRTAPDAAQAVDLMRHLADVESLTVAGLAMAAKGRPS